MVLLASLSEYLQRRRLYNPRTDRMDTFASHNPRLGNRFCLSQQDADTLNVRGVRLLDQGGKPGIADHVLTKGVHDAIEDIIRFGTRVRVICVVSSDSDYSVAGLYDSAVRAGAFVLVVHREIKPAMKATQSEFKVFVHFDDLLSESYQQQDTGLFPDAVVPRTSVRRRGGGGPGLAYHSSPYPQWDSRGGGRGGGSGSGDVTTPAALPTASDFPPLQPGGGGGGYGGPPVGYIPPRVGQMPSSVPGAVYVKQQQQQKQPHSRGSGSVRPSPPPTPPRSQPPPTAAAAAAAAAAIDALAAARVGNMQGGQGATDFSSSAAARAAFETRGGGAAAAAVDSAEVPADEHYIMVSGLPDDITTAEMWVPPPPPPPPFPSLSPPTCRVTRSPASRLPRVASLVLRSVHMFDPFGEMRGGRRNPRMVTDTATMLRLNLVRKAYMISFRESDATNSGLHTTHTHTHTHTHTGAHNNQRLTSLLALNTFMQSKRRLCSGTVLSA
jgi:hypothetical protein